ncbi:MAG: Gfo/Idh/MocA family oxidoreductase [Verrucomicrobia bacterium]|nr:Gfo/Idh/MocA family oxidoreductase [Verrucomicrobiota bacterium]
MKKHRVAVVGCGALAQGAHLPNCRQNPRIELIATCDLDRNTAEKCREQFGASRTETDWRRIVEAKDVDLCILCTHVNLRGEFIIPALESGKPVYTEKPLAPNRSEMIQIVQASRRTGKSVCVGHNRRSGPAVLEFKRLLDKARKTAASFLPSVDRSEGRPVLPEEKGLQLLIRVNDDLRSWKHWVYGDQEGVLFAEMVHFIDLALWFNDAPLVRVFAEGSSRGNFALLLRFADGSITNMHHTMVGHFDYPKELFEATLRNITIAMDQHIEVRQIGLLDEPVQRFFPFSSAPGRSDGQGMQGYMQAVQEQLQGVKSPDDHIRWIGVNKGHAAHLDRFLDHIEGRGPNPCDIEGAVAVNSVALKLLESVRLGLPVAVGPEDWHIP